MHHARAFAESPFVRSSSLGVPPSSRRTRESRKAAGARVYVLSCCDSSVIIESYSLSPSPFPFHFPFPFPSPPPFSPSPPPLPHLHIWVKIQASQEGLVGSLPTASGAPVGASLNVTMSSRYHLLSVCGFSCLTLRNICSLQQSNSLDGILHASMQ